MTRHLKGKKGCTHLGTRMSNQFQTATSKINFNPVAYSVHVADLKRCTGRPAFESAVMDLASCLAESPGRPVGNHCQLDTQRLPEPFQLDDLDALLAVPADWIVEPLPVDLRVPASCSGGSTESELPTQQNKPEAERRLAVARASQKRFRERHKVHLCTASACSQMWSSAETIPGPFQAKQKHTEADLAATKAELAVLQLSAKHLQARVALLERGATLSQADVNAHAQVSVQLSVCNKLSSSAPLHSFFTWSVKKSLCCRDHCVQ